MAFGGMNYLAVLIAAVAGWLVGAVWYMTLSGPWLAAQGKTMEECKREIAEKGPLRANAPYLVAFIGNLLIAWVLAGVIAHLGPGQVTLRNALISAAFVWIGFVASTMAVNYAFGGRSLKLYAIDAGHWLLALLAIGAVLGAMGVK